MPIPPPINSHAALCFGVAATSVGNEASGTETSRPSASTTFSVSTLQETATAVASLISVKVFIPFLQEELAVLHRDLSNFSKFVASKAAIVRELHRFKPKLGVLL